jgi:hypothetical protein
VLPQLFTKCFCTVVVAVPTIQVVVAVDIALLLATHHRPRVHRQFQVRSVVAVRQGMAAAEQDLQQRVVALPLLSVQQHGLVAAAEQDSTQVVAERHVVVVEVLSVREPMVRTSEVVLPTVTTMFLAKPLFVQRPTKTVVLLAISKITILTIVVTTLEVVAAVLMAMVLMQPHRTVLPTLVVQVVLVAGHTVFVEETAVADKAHKATGQQVVSLLVPGQS